MDGISCGIDELDTAFTHFKQHFTPLSAVLIDPRKTFDSASFDAIYSALQRLGVSSNFINYIRFVYSNARKYLSSNSTLSGPVAPRRGVLQSDALSSTLFLIVLDFVLRALPDHLGVVVRESVRILHIAYASDILLLARDANCLQELLNILYSILLSTGLEMNSDKSFTFSWISYKKLKRIIFDSSAQLYVGDST